MPTSTRLLGPVFLSLLFVAASPVGPSPNSTASSSPIANDDTTLAKTPPMGWNSWNRFGCDINAELIRETIDAMVESGMREAGYEYVNIDDCWMDSTRTDDGRLRPHPERFPNGIKTIADYAHERGLKLGIYESAGSETCQGYPGSLNHEKVDAETFARWGIDYLKYDNCGDHDGLSAVTRYRRMHEALEATGRPIVYSICEWGTNLPWRWAPDVGGNLWRTTGDIGPCFDQPCSDDVWQWANAVLQIVDKQIGLHKYSGPGHWNDPDMLEVGNEGLSYEESKTHFSLWAMLAAPLLAGNDLRSMSDSTRRILTNEEVIAVNQDSLGQQGWKIRDEGPQEVWVRPLTGGARAVLLLNRWHEPTTIRTSASEIGLPTIGSGYEIRDLWAHETEQSEEGWIQAEVPPHGVKMYRVRPLPGDEG